MPMDTLPEAYPRAFSLTFDQAIQQTNSKFKSQLTPEARWTAKEFVYKDLSKNTWTVNNSRGGTTVARESQFTQRKVYKQKLEAEAIEFYEWDQELLDNIVHPQSAEVLAMQAGYERGIDDLCITAFHSDMLGGPDPHNDPIAFPTSQIIPVNYVKPQAALAGSNLGLTPWKILRAKNIMEKLDLDLTKEDACFMMSPDDEMDLRLSVESAGNDTWAKSVQAYFDEADKGNPNARLMGVFRVIKSTRLAVIDAGGGNFIRRCGAFLRSGFIISPSTNMKSSMDRIPTDKNKLLLQGSAMIGVGRRSDEKFVSVPCAVAA